MICSINFLNNLLCRSGLPLLLVAIALAGCGGGTLFRRGPRRRPNRCRLVLARAEEEPSPLVGATAQAGQAGAADGRLHADHLDGGGHRRCSSPWTYRFDLEKDGDIQEAAATGSVPAWAWRPGEGGDYRVRVAVTDLRGNQAVGPWSGPYEIAPPLVIRPAGRWPPFAAVGRDGGDPLDHRGAWRRR